MGVPLILIQEVLAYAVGSGQPLGVWGLLARWSVDVIHRGTSCGAVVPPGDKGVVPGRVVGDYLGGTQHHSGIGGYVKGDHAVGPDAGVVSHGDVTNDFGTRPDVHVVADGGRTLSPAVRQGVGANGHLVKDGTSRAHLGPVGDEDAAQAVGGGKGVYVGDAGNVCIVLGQDGLVCVGIPRGQKGFLAHNALPVAPKSSHRIGKQGPIHFS